MNPRAASPSSISVQLGGSGVVEIVPTELRPGFRASVKTYPKPAVPRSSLNASAAPAYSMLVSPPLLKVTIGVKNSEVKLYEFPPTDKLNEVICRGPLGPLLGTEPLTVNVPSI